MSLFQITSSEVRNVQIAQVSALQFRVACENSAKTRETLQKHIRAADKLSAFTCAYIAHAGVDFAAVYSSTRYSDDATQMFNEKAIPKAWYLASVLNGGTFEYATNDGATLALVIKSIAAGITDNAGMKEYMRKGMCAMNKGNVPGQWNSQGTQHSSSTRACEALGILARDGNRGWKVGSVALFKRALDATSGIYANATDTDAEAEETADAATSFAGITIDGECYEVPTTLALSHDASAADTVAEAEETGNALAVIPATLAAIVAKSREPRAKRAKRVAKHV